MRFCSQNHLALMCVMGVYGQQQYIPLLDIPSPRSIVVRESAWGAGGRGSRHTKDVKNGSFALLSLAFGINELGIRLGGSESV